MGRPESSLAPTDIASSSTETIIGALFRRRYRAMVRLAAWLLGDASSAEDLVQDAFVRVARSDLTSVASLDAYLRTTVVNLTRTRRRRLALAGRHRIVEITNSLDSVPGPEALLADEDLADAVGRLPRRQRECVVLRYTEDLRLADIATALGISVGSVKTHLHRGLSALEDSLDGTEEP